MDDALLVVLIAVPPLAFVIALVTLATSGGAYDAIGRGGIAAAEDEPRADVAAEVRQVVEARNARRVARGEPPLDVEAEVLRRLYDNEERSGH
jgi:hypothetical protein